MEEKAKKIKEELEERGIVVAIESIWDPCIEGDKLVCQIDGYISIKKEKI